MLPRSDPLDLRPMLVRMYSVLAELDLPAADRINVEFRARLDEETRRLVLRATRFLPGQTTVRRSRSVRRQRETVGIEAVPLTWWDHLKQAINARWGWNLAVRTRHIPTVLETKVIRHKVVVTRVCPHVALAPEVQARGHFLWVDGEETPDAMRLYKVAQASDPEEGP